MKNKYYLLTSNEDWADEHNVPALTVFNKKEYDKWLKSKRDIYAYLGNSGDCFMEDEQDLTGSELIKNGHVEVFEVDENFVKIFKKAGLKNLSLSSIFDFESEEEEIEELED